jgi:hypothetical protein
MSTRDPLRGLRCLDDQPAGDALLDEIRAEVDANPVLEVMRRYIDELRGDPDNEAKPYQKLSRLFALGRTPEAVDGHPDGIALGLRTGDEPEILAAFGNLVGVVWGTTVGPVVPWVGKSFSTVEPAEIDRRTGGLLGGDATARLGVNHFHRLVSSRINQVGFAALRLLMHLKEAPEEERRQYGHDRDGGLFVAHRAPSVYQGTPREVYRLNYRFTGLENPPPFSYLVDELVEVSDGLYLGQLLFSTRSLLGRYDPALPDEAYRYQHFGYFLLMDSRFEVEVRRVFHNLGPLDAAPPAVAARVVAARPAPPTSETPEVASKLTTLTLVDPVGVPHDDALFATIRADLAREPTVLDLLARYAAELRDGDNDAPDFRKLAELFRRGVGPTEVHGYLRGAVVSFHSAGLYRLASVNTLDALWTFGRFLSPWTGKTFDPIDPARLADVTSDVTGGAPAGTLPVFWGANTVALRSAGQKLTGRAMKLAGVAMEAVPEEDARRLGYDAKTFFFVGSAGASILAENEQKPVFQLNYRWPRLHTFPPDNYCIDEIVQIADGLYLGQLIYATVLTRPYDPAAPPASYAYRVFGYFLLMDEVWQERRFAIGFDPDDA